MNHKKVSKWFIKHGIVLDESFASALRKMAEKYQKENKIPVLDDVYKLVGARKQYIYYWESHPCSTQTKNDLKRNVIFSSFEVFGLSKPQREDFANKAGLSCAFDKAGFNEFFRGFLEQNHIRGVIHGKRVVSERMFEYIRSGLIPSKNTLLSIAVSAGLTVDEIQNLLKRAGYVLSNSLPNDAAVLWLLEHELRPAESTDVLPHINEVLDELGLPLLMTRKK